MSQVSIIIPTLNEATNLGRTLRQLTLLNPLASEVIVVDGGSQDQTVTVAKQIFESFNQTLNVQVLSSQQPGRSLQMNYGASAATGDILCFLHADTWVPDDLITVINKTLAEPSVACGGFISLMSGSQTTRWGISLHNYLKTYYAPLLFKPHLFFRGLRLLFGDQVMFCRRIDFWDCGGFDEALPIMEDGDLCLKLVKKGRIYLVNRIVHSSDRRVAKWGSFKATAIYLYIGLLWGIGVNANYLKQFYKDIR
ncbi:TIGR04283 family arsenosugar biosynthesis glycosyltransferase [Nostoc sp. CHAB 5784]|uniref:TIGR04283 family arsenosugar biosynthesis glycosyltransferase n=1 Tax=Nostoc mirabile TaxID=2907820 RepID=UPI001E50FE73|nr:TIGR04283 family arsenosugar biosynthesis glycosyltransferase [Nostoc mirabile]MCC5669424.1 TIGR04283 family arsenosugar biosynthesis glycosyltransferase [Nostoc mirabile CHAB5784]